MLSPKDTIYPKLGKNISKRELTKLFTPSPEEIALAQKSKRGRGNRFGNNAHLYFLVMLKTFQRLGYFEMLTDIPYRIIKRIATNIGIQNVPKNLAAYDTSGTRQRHMNAIREYCGITAFGDESEILMDRAIAEVARSREDIADIINVAIEELSNQGHELPAFDTIQKAALKGRSTANQNLYSTIANSLDINSKVKIDQLFFINEGETKTEWNKLKSEPGKLTRNNLNERIDYFNWMIDYSIGAESLLCIPDSKIKKFYAEANSLDAARMNELTANKRYALFVAFIAKKISLTIDDLGDMLIKQINKTHTKAKSILAEHQNKNRDNVDELIDMLHQILVARKTGATSTERDEIEASILSGREEQLIKRCEEHSVYSGNNHFPFLWTAHAPYRSTLFKILTSIELGTTVKDNGLLDAINFIITHKRSWRHQIDLSSIQNANGVTDLSWISDYWWKLVFEKSRDAGVPETVDRRNFELCVFYYIKEGLKSGDLYIKNSDKFSDYRTQLICWESSKFSAVIV